MVLMVKRNRVLCFRYDWSHNILDLNLSFSGMRGAGSEITHGLLTNRSNTDHRPDPDRSMQKTIDPEGVAHPVLYDPTVRGTFPFECGPQSRMYSPLCTQEGLH
jgi:hypothetical protein